MLLLLALRYALFGSLVFALVKLVPSLLNQGISSAWVRTEGVRRSSIGGCSRFPCLQQLPPSEGA